MSRLSEAEFYPSDIDLFNRPKAPAGTTAHLVATELGAMSYYASVGLFDPKNWTVDGPIIAKKFGISYLKGVAAATGVGALIGLVLGMTFDPKHKSRGGLDEWVDYGDIWDVYFDTPSGPSLDTGPYNW